MDGTLSNAGWEEERGPGRESGGRKGPWERVLGKQGAVEKSLGTGGSKGPWKRVWGIFGHCGDWCLGD